MVYDPLASRRRGMLFGVIGCVLIGMAMGAMAFFRPDADPGDAPVIRSATGGLYVRIDGVIHPVANLASARLIAGAPADPVKAGQSAMAAAPKGPALGIPGAPDILPAATAGKTRGAAQVFRVCVTPPGATVTLPGHPGMKDGLSGLIRIRTDREQKETGTVVALNGAVTVIVDPDDKPDFAPLEQEQVIVARGGGNYWLVTSEGRKKFADTPAEDTPLWIPGEEIFNAIPEQSGQATENDLVDRTILDTSGDRVCVSGEDGVVSVTGATLPRGVELPGRSVATRYDNATGMGLGVSTGSGWWVISDTGRRFAVDSPEDLAVLGVTDPIDAPWSIIRLLPEGPALTKQNALEPLI